MPSFDGGHYFLTTLIPVKTCADGPGQSHVHRLRALLATLPTALQSPANEHREVNAPFARNHRTHLLRMLVVDNVAFNGRARVDAIWSMLLGMFDAKARHTLDLSVPNLVDQLPCPYLVLAADFDAQAGPAGEPQAYLRGLWDDAGEALAAIVAHCDGFDGVSDAASFNDYWQTTPDLSKLSISMTPLLIPAGVGAAVFLAGLARLLLGWVDGWIGLLVGAAVVYLGLRFFYGSLVAHGAKPLPTPPDSDLPSVLKALYLRQRFVRFAIDNQGANPDDLHAAFGAFLADHRPLDVDAPTQPPGVVRS
jgi:hypothetical protein